MCSFVSTFRYLLQTKLSSSLIIFKRQYLPSVKQQKYSTLKQMLRKKTTTKKLHRTSYWQISAEYWSGTERFCIPAQGNMAAVLI